MFQDGLGLPGTQELSGHHGRSPLDTPGTSWLLEHAFLRLTGKTTDLRSPLSSAFGTPLHPVCGPQVS